MPDEQLTPGETARSLARIETQLQRVLTQEVWVAERREIERRLAEGERERVRLRDEHERDVETLRVQRETDSKDRANNRRWLIGVVTLPVLSMALTVVLIIQTGGAG